LEEVQRASLILHIADATSPNATEQREQVENVLAELEAQNKPAVHVLNKIDLLSAAQRNALPTGENVVQVSAIKGIGLETLLQKIDAALTVDPIAHIEISVPQSEGKVLAMIEARGNVLKREYRNERVQLSIEGPQSLLRQLQPFLNRTTSVISNRQSHKQQSSVRQLRKSSE